MTHIHTLKVKWQFSLFFVFILNSSFAQEDLSLLFVGDVMQHDAQIEAAFNKQSNTYEYNDGFKFVKPIIEAYDIRVANLEVTLAGKPFKGYPQFSAPDDLAETLVSNGFNVILTSNNHSCDRGTNGVLRTIDQLDKLGVAHTGTFRSQQERDSVYPLIIHQNGIKIAMLNYTYGTNGLVANPPVIINYIDSALIKKDIKRAKELGAEYIICNMHWGKEYKFFPNDYQKIYEQICYREGADMVIGGHPHVVQPIEKKNVIGQNKLTVWSLGNFVSNMRTRPTRGGLMVGATIGKNNEQIELKGVHHHLVYVLKKNEGAVTQYYILPDFDYNRYRSGFIDPENSELYANFMSDSRKLLNEHNRNCQEQHIREGSEISNHYKKLLTHYFSVHIEGQSDDLLLNKHLKQYFHETIDSAGKSHILSGVYDSVEEAKDQLAFIKDLKLSGTASIVSVEPGTINFIEE